MIPRDSKKCSAHDRYRTHPPERPIVQDTALMRATMIKRDPIPSQLRLGAETISWVEWHPGIMIAR